MARLLGIVLPDEARVEYALTKFYGIGWKTSGKILDAIGVDKHKRVKDLHEDDMKKISGEIEKSMLVEGELREKLNDDIKRLREIVSYRGVRHMRGLPVRGQRTKSNGRTKKGKRKTVGALTKEAWAKAETAQQSSATAAKK